jgi:uncharacterized protein YuzE
MRFEYDKGVNALYIYFREIPDGAVVHNIELQEGVYLDADSEGRTLGIEFLDLEDFRKFLERHDGRVRIPEHIKDLAAADLSPA